MEQNTQEWLEMRRNKIGASDAPIIMEESPYGTPYKLWEEKMGIKVKEQHAGMRYGHEMEPVARKLLEDEFMCTFEPKVIVHPDRPWMMASLDALNVDSKLAAEIKNPCEEDHEIARSGEVPPKYVAQVQHQLEILFAIYGINELYYFSHRKGDKAILSVGMDKGYITTMVKKEEEFWMGMQNFTPPKLGARDYFELQGDKAIAEAEELIAVTQQMKSLKERESALRKSLIGTASGHNLIYGGMKLTRVVSKGTVDYKSIPALEGVDLEQYRKPPVESWRLSCS